MKGLLFFLGGLTAAAILIAAAVLAFRRAIRCFSRRYFGTADFSGLLHEINVGGENPAEYIRKYAGASGQKLSKQHCGAV